MYLFQATYYYHHHPSTHPPTDWRLFVTSGGPLCSCVLTCGRQATKAPPNFLVPHQTHTPSSGLMHNNWNNNVIIFPTRLTTRRKENFPDRYSHYPYLLSLALHSAPTHTLRCHSATVVVVVVSCAAHHARRFALNIRWTKTLYRFTW